MRGEDLPIKEALIRLTVLRRQGKWAALQFRCEHCSRLNKIPQKGEGKTIIQCGFCEETNYLDSCKVIDYAG